MRTAIELRKYASDFQIKHNGYLPMVFVVEEGVIVRNAEKTSDQRPWGSETYANFSWIEYWRAFANARTSPTPAYQPRNCSAESFIQKFILGANCPTHNGDIVGAHVKISRNGGMTWSQQTYIVPLCSECNGKHGQIVNVQSGTRLVEVVDPVR